MKQMIITKILWEALQDIYLVAFKYQLYWQYSILFLSREGGQVLSDKILLLNNENRKGCYQDKPKV